MSPAPFPRAAAVPKALPPHVHTFNRIPVYHTGVLSASGSALLLAAKVPVTAKNLRFAGMHNSGATGLVLNVGLRHGHSASTSISALGQMDAQNVPVWTNPVDVDDYWDDAGGERWKYVTFSKQSGTASASFVLQGEITYDFYSQS